MKVRALPKFEGIKDLERNIFPKTGDIWEVSPKRAKFLKSHGVVEIIEEKEEITEKNKIEYDIPENTELKTEFRPKKNNKKNKKAKNI